MKVLPRVLCRAVKYRRAKSKEDVIYDDKRNSECINLERVARRKLNRFLLLSFQTGVQSNQLARHWIIQPRMLFVMLVGVTLHRFLSLKFFV